jgi:hypothetical protein
MKSTEQNEKVQNALKQLLRTPCGPVIVDWFKESLEEQREQNEECSSSNDVFRGQGAARTIKDFLREVEKAK